MLTDEQAYDVAGYIVSQDRPKKANLDEDFPIRLQRPVDTPYDPYAVAVADKKLCISSIVLAGYRLSVLLRK